MKKFKLYSILFISVLFVSVNVYFIEKTDSKVSRTSYVEDWKGVTTSNLKKQVIKTGVIDAGEERNVYFDRDSNGAFEEFLVKEGDSVEIGTPLFSYEVDDRGVEASFLKSEIQQLEDKIDSIKDHIDDLDDLKPAYTPTPLPSFNSAENEEIEDKSIEASNLEIESSIEIEIADKELEISLLEDKINHLERQLSVLESEETSISVLSETEGIVKMVSEELSNPLIVISSNTRIATGTLNETETLEVTEGQKAAISSAGIKEKLEGTISSISELPEKEPESENLSEYRFKVDLEENNEKLLPGYHITMAITTREANNAFTVSNKHILREGPQKQYLFLLTDKGIVEKRKIETGLSVDGKVEVTKGLKKGEMYILEPLMFIEDNAEFVTPLRINELAWKNIKSSDRHTIIRNIVLGLLER
jgi:HlyD family secretion protein